MPYARLLDLPKNSVTLLHSLVGGNEFTAFVVAGEGADMENVNAIAMLSISTYVLDDYYILKMSFSFKTYENSFSCFYMRRTALNMIFKRCMMYYSMISL